MDQGRLDGMIKEIWEWLDVPEHATQDIAAYSASFDRAIRLEHLSALQAIQANLDRIATACERAYPRYPTK